MALPGKALLRALATAARERRARIALASLVAASAAVVLLTAGAALGRRPYFELCTHFRIQYAVVGAAAALGLALSRRFATSLVPAACVVANLVYLAPFYAAATPVAADASSGSRVRLMLSNVYLGNRDYESLVARVKEERPDVLVLEEVTAPWWRNLEELRRIYPYYNALPKQGGSGIAIFSRLPVRDTEVLVYDTSSMPGMFATLELDGRPFSVLALHPPTPTRPDKLVNRNLQFALAARRMRDTPGPRVLIGDLNCTPFSPYFQDLVRDSGLRDARDGMGLWPTWPMPLPAPLRIPIDHCLASDDVRVDAFRAGGRTGSDHRPLVVDVTVAE